MKKITVLLFVFNIVLNLMAQKKVNLDTLNIYQLNLYKEQAIKLRKTGTILTLAGLAGYTTGTLLMVNYMNKTPMPDWGAEGAFYGILGLCGAASTITGIPLWIVGGSRKSKVEIVLKKFDNNTGNSMAFGLGLTFRF
jgi:hypothetical protein